MATVSKYETKAGIRWEVRYRTPSNATSRKRGFGTARDAKAYAAQLEVAKQTGAFVQASSGRATVGSLGPAWLERQRGHLKPSAWRSLESAWRVQCSPRWATVPLNRIRYTEVQAWVAELSVTRGPTVVRTAHSVLSRILDDACRDRLLAANPARGVRLPRRTARPSAYLTHDQVRSLATECEKAGKRSLVLLAAYGGCRWGELAALTPRDFDWEKQSVRLERNAVRVGSNTVVGTLKNGEARTCSLPAFVVDELRATCVGRGRDELLWQSRTGGFLGPPSSHDSWLSGAVQRCQAADPTFPRITAHGLRHTCASLAASAGVPARAVQAQLGHKSSAMTDRYTHLLPGDLPRLAAALEAAAKARPKAPGPTSSDPPETL